MKKLLLETSLSKIYILTIILGSILIVGGYFSYAMFTVTKQKNNAISIVTGNLTYKLEVDGSESNTLTVPAFQTACGGFDIMAHMFDMNYFVNAKKYPLQFNVVETLLKTVRQQLPIAIQEPENYEARATMLWAASWALNSFCTSGFQTQASLHALEQFSSSYDLTHGLALAILMPKWMKYLLDRDETVADDFARFGVNVMGVEESEDKKAVAYQAIEALQYFIKDELGLPVHLSELGIDDSQFEKMKVKACYGQESLPRAYRPLTQEDCFNIYKMCL